jgi:hypothetical protein
MRNICVLFSGHEHQSQFNAPCLTGDLLPNMMARHAKRSRLYATLRQWKYSHCWLALLNLSHYASWRRRVERRYSTYSLSTSVLDGSEWSASRPGRAIAPGKGPTVPIVQEAGWAPEPVWTQRLQEKSFVLPGIESGSPARPVCSQTLYWPEFYFIYSNSLLVTFSPKKYLIHKEIRTTSSL